MTRRHLQDDRLRLLELWLDQVLPDHGPAEPASSDASFRRYFRVFSQDKSWIVMDAPPEREDCRPFLAVCAALLEVGVRVPAVHAQDLAQGFLLLDDLGGQTFLSALPQASADQAYRRAIDELVRIQAAESAQLPSYDAALLHREMDLFHDWYLERHRQRELSVQEQADWQQACASLAEAALAQPRVFVHRDYHSRNLMWAEQGALGVLDFQDAVCGPVSYDLVSLLRDCYVQWPLEQVHAWLAYYHEQASAAGIAVPDLDSFRRDFDWMGVQRHLKAAGIFARLYHRDGKDGYLQDIPRTLGYVRQVARTYPELQALHALVDSCLNH